MTNELKEFIKVHKPETISTLMRWEKYKKIKTEIIELTSFLKDDVKFSERVYCLENNISHIPQCLVCGKETRFKTFGEGYSETCSRECRYKHQPKKIKKTIKERYGVEHALQSEEFLEKSKKTCKKNFGVENIFQNTEYIRKKTKEKLGVENIFEKTEFIQMKFKEKYGSDHPSKVSSFVEQAKSTCLEKYGVEFSFQSNNNKEKAKKTKLLLYGDEFFNNREKAKKTLFKRTGYDNIFKNRDYIEKRMFMKYGVKHPLQNEIIKEKFKATMQQRYDVMYPMESDIIREKFRDSCLKTFGVQFPLQNETIKEKFKATMLDRYGVESPMQHTESHEKQQKYKWKDYILPSKKIIKVQGYEGKALDILLETYNETEIITSRKEMPEIWYYFENRKRKYYPDIFIPKDNKIIEVKSNYTYYKDLNKNLAKEQAVKNEGFSFIFMIFDK